MVAGCAQGPPRDLTELVTVADSYRLTFEREVGKPLRTLVLTTPIALDEALAQWRPRLIP